MLVMWIFLKKNPLNVFLLNVGNVCNNVGNVNILFFLNQAHLPLNVMLVILRLFRSLKNLPLILGNEGNVGNS